ncbi:uncharacterized protein LOC107036605 [Diachasma alloeum]|uniref:uncharacterized protein LOC107036605 n=1 Tax=Diachasma alloeum TaxID=454923 RepID=UPI0007382A63|nr:uncharacterized protein LOC107036605 [Diachasma alloeum]
MVYTCLFPGCSHKSRFQFPRVGKDPQIRQKWLDFIGIDFMEPASRKGLCEAHFTPDQFIIESADTGLKLIRARLKTNAVPTIAVVQAKKPPEEQESIPVNIEKRSRPKSLEGEDVTGKMKKTCVDTPLDELENTCANSEKAQELQHEYFNISNEDHTYSQTVEMIADDKSYDEQELLNKIDQIPRERVPSPKIISPEGESQSQKTQTEINNRNQSTQTDPKRRDQSSQTGMSLGYSIHDLRNNNEAILYFTGLENYTKFRVVLASLGPGVFTLKYKYWHVQNVSVEDQLFITLWKLRRNTSDFELGFHFQVSKTAVSNILHTWIPFIADQWRKLDSWPSRELVDHFMPECFKKRDPQEPVDEIQNEIDGSSNDEETSGNFNSISTSADARRNDLEMIGDSPPAGGSTAQDILAQHEVHLKMPHLLEEKDQLRRRGSQHNSSGKRGRSHIERLINCMDNFKILKAPLSSSYVDLADDVVSICMILCCFREYVMKAADYS